MEMYNRPRRLRRNRLTRELASETNINLKRLIQPYFVCEGSNIKDEINGLPKINRESVDSLVKSVSDDIKLGISNIMLFGVTDRKDQYATSAYDNNNPVIQATGKLKDKFGDDILIGADVCLCAYTDTGHCGVTENDKINNDKSVEILADMALKLAENGCDIVAPSDMMDGRVAAIRQKLETNNYTDTLIMAYTAKYSSAYYGPFREAANSSPGKGDRKGYQMDFRNRSEAMTELELDMMEGADIVMVKPALAYLDIIADFQKNSSLPIAAYNVSGEYTSVKLLAQTNLADEKTMVIENLTAMTRAGATIILTYHLRDILKNGWHNA